VPNAVENHSAERASRNLLPPFLFLSITPCAKGSRVLVERDQRRFSLSLFFFTVLCLPNGGFA